MSAKNPKVAVVGATGAVGREMLEVLAQRQFPASEVVPFASSRSAGGKVEYADGELTVRELTEDSFAGFDLALFSAGPVDGKRITAEVCVHHLWFTDADYGRLGARIKWNPAIKSRDDREALREALHTGRLDVVATDHAPHLLSEKEGGALKAASGGPLVQHSLQVMLELAKKGLYTNELVVEKMCHAPARLFRVKERGFIREGYYADLVLVDPAAAYTVSRDNILYKCGWSPFEGESFSCSVQKTFVNGNLVFDNGVMSDHLYGKALTFDR